MVSFRRALHCAAIGVALLLSAGQASAYRTPEAVIRAIYVPLLNGAPPPPQSLLYSAEAYALIEAFRARYPANIAFLPLVEIQEVDIARLDARQVRLDAVSADIVVSFDNFGAPTRLMYRMIREPDGWRIDDISGVWASGPWTVRELLTADRIIFVETVALP